jgi:hypothetical protein
VEPTPLRTTEFAAALPDPNAQAATCAASSAPASGYAPPTTAISFKTGRFTGADFPLQPDGTLRCPAGQSLLAHERRREADGSLRIVYAASIRSCRPCPLREQCQWNGNETAKPRQVSVLLHPLSVGGEPLLWRDWSRRVHRRACMQLLRHQRVEIHREPEITPHRDDSSLPLSRASRVHSRLSWAQRQERNARRPTPSRVLCNGVKRECVSTTPVLASRLFCNSALHTIRYGVRRPLSSPIKLHLFGMPNAFAAFLGLEAMGV